MNRLILGGVATGGSGILAVAGALLLIDPFSARGAADPAGLSVPPGLVAPVGPIPSHPATTSPATTAPTAKPSTARPPAAKPSAAKSPAPSRSAHGVDAAGAAAIVGGRFAGAKIIETEREEDGWELTFLWGGVENEVHVDPRTGRLFDHEVEDD
ncbi:hypothetical protein [Pseudosporangium ferrugineum]|nr:hypothetical protein [Pseudosporangium ferrugineum]